MEVPDSQIMAASFSPDGSLLVSANPFLAGLSEQDFPPAIWDAATGKQVRSLAVPAPTRPQCFGVCQTTAAVFSSDGDMIVTAGHEGVVRLWDASTGELLRSLEEANRGLFAAALSPDERWIAAGTLESVLVWDATSGELAHVLDAPGFPVDFNPAGDLLAVGSEDGIASIWEVATGRLAGELRHAAAVESVAWSRDGRFLLTSINDGFPLWDVASQQQIHQFPGSGPIASFAPDDAILTGRADGTIHTYRCEVCGSVEELIETARDRVIRELTPVERQRFLQEAEG